MADLSFYVGVIGNLTSMLVFLSPIGTFRRIVRMRSTEEYEILPYMSALVCSSFWTYYGIVTRGEYLVATVNGFGTIVEAIYVTLFLIYVSPHRKLNTALVVGMVNVCFPATAIAIARNAFQEEETHSHAIGFVCAFLTIIMYASPLTAMKTVVTTKSVEYMPFWLSFFLFLNGTIWGIYAYFLNDFFILVPNGMGFALGAMQLILYATYRNAKPKDRRNGNNDGLSDINEDDEEAHSPRRPLLS